MTASFTDGGSRVTPKENHRLSDEKKRPNKESEAVSDSMTSAALLTVFFTAWIYVIVEKSMTGHWGLLDVPSFPTKVDNYFNLKTLMFVLGWYIFQCLLYLVPVGGSLVEGTPTKDTGNRLKYRLNAFFVLCVNVSVFLLACLCGVNMSLVSSKRLYFTTSGVLIIMAASIVLLTFRVNKSLKGNAFNVWFQGADLNPRIGLLDLKYVTFRSAIIGWVLMNFVNLSESFDNGNRPSPALLALVALQLLYVADYFWFEDGVLVTRDIVHEKFGYNRLVQFLMIPFIFAVQTNYLLKTQYTLPWYCLVAVIALNLFGYWIYRGSNSEKNAYRRNPNNPRFSGYEVIQTSSGKNLLVSGWWGLCRHPNYLGDIIIALSYGLFTGFNHFLPYFNAFFLIMMLVDREKQDGEECRKRYGESWEKYCHRVKYRIVPYLY